MTLLKVRVNKADHLVWPRIWGSPFQELVEMYGKANPMFMHPALFKLQLNDIPKTTD